MNDFSEPSSEERPEHKTRQVIPKFLLPSCFISDKCSNSSSSLTFHCGHYYLFFIIRTFGYSQFCLLDFLIHFEEIFGFISHKLRLFGEYGHEMIHHRHFELVGIFCVTNVLCLFRYTQLRKYYLGKRFSHQVTIFGKQFYRWYEMWE